MQHIPHYAVHSRLQARKRALKHFRDKKPGEMHDDPLCAACIAELDTGIGLVLDKLDELGLAKNTLMVFTSDNGGTAWSQEPLRGKKGSYYEGGIRVPMVVRWPGVVAAETICDEPVINVDLYPTFLAVAKTVPPAKHPLDGANLLPLFQGGKQLEREAIFWHFPGYLNGPVPRGRDPVILIRKGAWKLHLYHEEWQLDGGRDKLGTNHAVELYDLAHDPGERKDLALVNGEKREAGLLFDRGNRKVRSLVRIKVGPLEDAALCGMRKNHTKSHRYGLSSKQRTGWTTLGFVKFECMRNDRLMILGRRSRVASAMMGRFSNFR